MIAIRSALRSLPSLSLSAEQFTTLHSAKEFKSTLLNKIRTATQRIYISALYLEQDEAGIEVFDALYAAKQNNPNLDVQICVDWHRAQRGLFGAEKSDGNAGMYRDYAEKHEHSIPVYGVPVRGREVFGVLHLKGFVIDDTVIYSGASLNNVYLHHKDKYRLDRYHLIDHSGLSDSFVQYIKKDLIDHPAVCELSKQGVPATKNIKGQIRQLRSSLANSYYQFQNESISSDALSITPLVGVGKRRNHLNHAIVQLLKAATQEIVICTPYFNFPKPVAKEIKKAIRRGVEVKIIVGDKTANDFYVAPDQEFHTAGGLPYLYEMNLRRYAKINEAHLASRKLSLFIWKHEKNSFHLKGIWVDKKQVMLTGNNLNPRAWSLDLENGLYINDPKGELEGQFQLELDNVLEHSTLICTYKQLEKQESYPDEVQKLLKKITRIKADSILKKLL
jgi:CDP-diacylglycerol--serine O-phosphatidyltransferase